MFDCRRVEIEGAGRDISKHRRETGPCHCVSRAGKSERADDHLAAHSSKRSQRHYVSAVSPLLIGRVAECLLWTRFKDNHHGYLLGGSACNFKLGDCRLGEANPPATSGDRGLFRRRARTPDPLTGLA